MIGRETQICLVNKLENIHHVVVQASAIDGSNVFALQLLHKQSDVVVTKLQMIVKLLDRKSTRLNSSHAT